MADSVSIESLSKSVGEKAKKASAGGAPSLKIIVAIFLIFLFVVSDIFKNNILGLFGDKAVRGRDATAAGAVIQGIFLVIFYILAFYLIEKGVL